MHVYFTPESIADLHEIAVFIGKDNPARAATFVEELVFACKELAQMPNAYPLRQEMGRNVRVRFRSGYAIIYRVVDGSGVEVLRVSHGSRRLSLLRHRKIDGD